MDFSPQFQQNGELNIDEISGVDVAHGMLGILIKEIEFGFYSGTRSLQQNGGHIWGRIESSCDVGYLGQTVDLLVPIQGIPWDTEGLDPESQIQKVQSRSLGQRHSLPRWLSPGD